MKTDRLFRIIYLLLEKGNVTAEALAEELEVSVRTIYRDIDVLCSVGVPVYANAGKGGGYGLMEGFVMRNSLLSKEDQNYILLALQNLQAADHVEVDEILSKLKSTFQQADTAWIEVDYTRWGNRRSDKEKFETLKRAVIEKRKIHFTYISSYGEPARRITAPLKLVFKSKSWYLQGYCYEKKGYRTFKINRMSDLEITDEKVDEIFGEVPPVDIYEVPREGTWLTLKFKPALAHRIYDEFAVEHIKKMSDGTYLVEEILPEGRWLYEYLLSFGEGMEVQGPAHIRKGLEDEIRKLSSLYRLS